MTTANPAAPKPLRAALRAFFGLWFRLDVIGGEHLATPGPLIYLTRQTSPLDAALLFAIIPRPAGLVVTRAHAEAGALRRLASAAPVVVPDRPSVVRGLLAAIRAGGACALDIDAPAAGWLIAHAGAPIVPIHIEGLELSRWAGERPGFPRRLAPRVRVTVGPPQSLALDPALEGRARRERAMLRAGDLLEELRRASLDRHASIPRALAATATAVGAGRPAITDPNGETLTLGRVFLGADAFARVLARAGLAPGERIGVLLPTVGGVPVVLTALWRLNLIAAMLNPTLGPGPMLSCLATARVSRVITSRLMVREAKLQPQVDAILAAGHTILWTEDLRKAVDTRMKLLAALSARLGRARRGLHLAGRRPIAKDDPAVILFTSGTEGAPKGVVLSHGNLLGNVTQLLARTDINPSDRMLAALPVFHSFGLTGGILLPLIASARVVTYPNPLHYKAIPELARKEGVTVIFGTDTFLAGWGRRAEDGDFATVRAAIAGAEAVKPATRALWRDRFGAAILEGYGATEASPVLALNTPAVARRDTVGRLLPGIAARLEPVPGIAGERLVVRGPNIMRGYLRPEAPDTIEAPPGGWYDTGDAVTIDADGFVAIRGRIKRFAKIGGEMVSLAAVEALAHRTWPDAPVAAIALPDPRKGNRVVLVLGDEHGTLDATLAPLQAQARREGIAEIMLPARVIALAALPLLGSGKPDYPGLERLVLEREDRT